MIKRIHRCVQPFCQECHTFTVRAMTTEERDDYRQQINESVLREQVRVA